MKTKALISFAVTAKLICVFVFAYAKSRFSHDAAHFFFLQTGFVDVTVNVLNANDNNPQFNQTVYTFNVFENEAAGTSVGLIYVSV